VIEVVKREVRAPGANEVRIEVKAAAVNPTDILLRASSSRSNLRLPNDQPSLTVPGMDAAGVIESSNRARLADDLELIELLH